MSTRWVILATMTMAVKTSTDASALVIPLRRAIQDIDPEQPVFNVRTMDDIIALSAARPRLNSTLVGLFALLALALAAVGTYGVVAYTVALRTREFAVRLAVGASHAAVMRDVCATGIRLGATGVVIGLAGAFALGRYLRQLLYGVEASDPATFMTAALVLTGMALAASWLPARRVLRIDPVSALRQE